MNIIQALNAVRSKVPGYIKKDATVQGYKAITHDNVIAHVRAAFIEHGVILLPELISDNTELVEVSKNGNTRVDVHYRASYRIWFVASDGSRESVVVPGHAVDQSDKGPGKSLSYAVKYAILKVCMIETGENDESRVETVKTITKAQIEILNALMEQTGDMDILSKVLVAFNIDSLDLLPASNFSKLQAKLQATIRESKNGNNS